MSRHPAAVRAVLFDLDDTLLENNGDLFFEAYLDALARHLEGWIPRARLVDAAMVAGAAMMAEEHPEHTNEAVLLEALPAALGVDPVRFAAEFRRFERSDFRGLGPPWRAHPWVPDLVRTVVQRDIAVVVATSPIYPLPVIEERMRRAGVLDLPWSLVTSWDRMHSTKPNPSYFQEIARLLDLPPEACVMVGDDYFQDIVARRIGMHTYFVGRPLPGLDTGPGGSLREILGWLEAKASA